jgi:hypothetical protein
MVCLHLAEGPSLTCACPQDKYALLFMTYPSFSLLLLLRNVFKD